MLGQEIKRKRLELGMTQEQLAQLLGTRQSTVAMYETNRLTPSRRKLVRLREVLAISLDKFLS